MRLVTAETAEASLSSFNYRWAPKPQVGWIRKKKLRGLSNVHPLVCFAAAAFNLKRQGNPQSR